MASPRLAKRLAQLKNSRKARALTNRLGEVRRMNLEQLEDRRLMAVGPSLVNIIPNSGVFLNNNDTLNVSPRELTFRFAQGSVLDANTLQNGFILTSAGNDRILGNTDDQAIAPGFLGLGDTAREVVMRFASTLPNNLYSVTLVGASDPFNPSWSPIKDATGNPFNSGDPSRPNTSIRFSLDTGAKIDAIVPQPIVRTGNVLQQSANTIDVYFDQQMNTTDVTKPGFYRLIDATTGSITLPQSIAYSDDATLALGASGATLLSFNGTAATSPLTISNQSTRVTVTSAGAANTGTFTLTVNGATTGPIPASGATVANVLNVLNAIPSLKGNVAVTAGPGGLGIIEQFDISFVGAFTGRSASVFFNPIGTGTAGSAVNTVNATNLAASAVQTNLNTIPSLNGRVAVTGPVGGPYNIQFINALAGTNVTLTANAVPSATVTGSSQTVTLVTTGSTLFSFNGVNALSPLLITTGTNGTTAAAVLNNLNTIPALVGKVSVTGSIGGPFTISTNNLAAGTVSSLIRANTNSVTVATNTQTLGLVANGTTNLSFNGATATSPLAVTTGAAGTTSASVQAALNTIPGLAGQATAVGANGGPFTITFSGSAATTNAALVARNPSGVVATVTHQPKATLTFAAGALTGVGNNLGSTFKLEVGTTTEPNDRITVAQHIGNSMATSLAAFIGDNPKLLVAQTNDVDLYRFELESDVTDFSINVAPTNGLDTYVRLFEANGTPVAAMPFVDSVGNGVADSVSGVALPRGVYYVGVSSTGNINYDPNVESGTGGTATGAYSIKVSFSDLSATLDDTLTFDNSSFGSPTVLGVIGTAGRTIAGVAITPSPDLAQQYYVQMPGAGDAPGERNIPFQGHTTTVPGRLPDPVSGIETVTYDFQQVYGYTPQGQQFSNAITEPQKQRAREAMELYGRYLGVQFLEVADSRIADMTIATGDPRAIAPTISTGTGVDNNGTNSISGVPSIVSTADATDMFTHVVTDASNASPIVITSANHGLADGNKIKINGVLQNTAANGVWTVTIIDSNRFSLTNSVGNNPYGGGGTWGRANDITVATDTYFAYTQQNQIEITSPAHGLSTGQFIEISGAQGMTSANGVWKVTVVNQDRFFLSDELGRSQGNGTYFGGGTWTLMNVSKGLALVNALVDWEDSPYGGEYFKAVMHQVGHLLGLGDNFEAPAFTVMGGGEVPSQAANTLTAEQVFPGDADIVYGQTVHRPENRDIDLYQFTVSESGTFRSETIAERLPNSSLLNTVLTLYQESEDGKTRTQIARNDDYYGNDSYLEVHLAKGTYYLAVTSVGNTDFDPTIPGTGFGGRTQGAYSLAVSIKPDGGTTSMRDATGVSFDGDAENSPGGTYQFWLQGNNATNTVYVDKASTANQNLAQNPALGTIGSPYNTLAAALTRAGNSGKSVVRIVGNGGTDNDINTFIDDRPYLVGFRDANRTQPLADGGDFQVPKNVTVMIDAGAAFKLRRTNLNAGTTPQGLVSRSGAAIQVLGTPQTPVVFTSWADDSVGGDSDGPSTGAMGGDYGGIVYRNDSDYERDYQSPTTNPLNLVMPVFLNYVNHAMMTYGGGKVTVDSVEEVYDPIYMDAARPSISYNTIQQSASAALSASPNTFDDDGLSSVTGTLVAFDDRRIGPDIHDNRVVNNSLNGMFVRVRTQAGSPIDFVDLPTRWNDADIVHIVSENIKIAGTPAGSVSPGSDRTTTTLTDGRLRIDPGLTIKLGGARIETQISSQFIAEGTQSLPIVFTSVKDDRYGAGGTFDTNRDGSASAASTGNWAGLVFGPASTGSVSQARVFYGGGSVPIEGGFDSFNAVEVQQADVRIVNSVFQFNGAGGGSTDRNGLGLNGDATIFVRGAQPIVANNVILDNEGPVMSINANAMQAVAQRDWGQSTGLLNIASGSEGNYGPFVRNNRLDLNRANGMVVRGGTLTTETVWDDTDITHILFDEIVVPNHQVYSGIRLQSESNQSLVVKASGPTAGITASGTPLDIADRIGGTVQIIGQPGFPVVMTSLADCSVGSGFTPDGLPMNDTLNSGICGAEVDNPPYADVIVVMDESASMFFAQQFSIQFIADLESGLLTKGLGSTPAGGNQFALLGFGGAGSIELGQVIPVGANNAPFGTAAEYGVAAMGLVSNGGIEDGYAAMDLMLQSYQPRVDAAKFVILVTNEDRDVVNNSLTYSTTLVGLQNAGYKLEGILAPQIVSANGQRALALDSFKNAYSDNGTGGFTVSANGRFGFSFDTSVPDYADMVHATGGIVGDINQISNSAQTAQIFSQVLVSSIVDQALGIGAQSGDWRGLKLDQFSNDRNVGQITERENGSIGTNADITAVDFSRTPQGAQSLGSLAPNLKSGDDTRRLGFQVDGTIAYDNPADVDVYSFNADSGTEVWVDIDRTSYGLDAMVELVNSDGEVLARATDTTPDVTDIHNPLTPTDPGLTNFTADPNLVRSFNKDPFNGRDTFSTNVGATRIAATGTIQSLMGQVPGPNPGDPPVDVVIEPGVTNSFPIVIRSLNHGLASGDRVEIKGVEGTTSANGIFTVSKVDTDRFLLNGSLGNGVYVQGGTWSKLVTTTRDPIMRLVLPNAANGQPLKDSPFFIRVRSQPQNFAGEQGNTLNPGLTSGVYQMQVRLQQKDEKPGSTIRFSDLRYATNAIEVIGLPNHSPLTGETVEADSTRNNNQTGAQNIGNLLRADRNVLSVGGTLSSATDVDWYQFDLNFDLLNYVTNYTDGHKTWSTIFDLDYGDGLSRADTTLSVFDQNGRLILIGRDSDVRDDQGTQTSNTSGGTFGKHDAFIGPAQLPAVVPGQSRSYFVAVSSDRMMPQVLDQAFLPTATNSNVRVEPIESVARVVEDPLEPQIRGRTSSGGTAEFPSNAYIDPETQFSLYQPSSTFIDTKNIQSLQANVRPFSLADVQLLVSTTQQLYSIDPTVGLAFASTRTDFQTTFVAPGNASVTTDFDTALSPAGSVTGTFTAVAPGAQGNSIILNFSKADRTNANQPGVGITKTIVSGITRIDIQLDTRAQQIADQIAQQGTTIDDLALAIADPLNGVNLDIALTYNSFGIDIANATANQPTYTPLQLSGGSNTPGVLSMVFAATQLGTAGNNTRLTFSRVDRTAQGGGPLITVNGNNLINPAGPNTIDIVLDTQQRAPNGGTTAQDLVNFLQSSGTPGASAARQLITARIAQGGGIVDIANPPNDGQGNPAVQPPLQLSGGNDGFGGLEARYDQTTFLRTGSAANSAVNDIAFRGDGELFGYEGIFSNTNNGTAGRLTQVDSGAGNASAIGNDSIPDQPAQPVVPPTIQSIQALTSNGGDALAWGGTPINGIDNTSLYYAVPDFAVGASRLYQANPANGSAAFVQGSPWGLSGLITNATAATGSTDFVTASPAVNPTPPVTVAFRSIQLGAPANGTQITFAANRLGFDPVTRFTLPPRVTFNPSPPVLSVEMNLDISNSSSIQTFAGSGAGGTPPSTDILFEAGINRTGAQGNQVVILISRADRNGAGPLVNFGGTNNNTITVTMDTSFISGNPAPGTTAGQFASAINTHPLNQGIIAVTPNQPDAIISGTPITSVRMTGGSDPTTAQDLINAINNFFVPPGQPVPAGQLVQASLAAGSGSTIVALTDSPISSAGKVYNSVTLTGASDTPGFTKGLAFDINGSTLFGVTDQGQFLRNISLGSGIPAVTVPISLPDPINLGRTLSGADLRFAALSRGPENVEGGRFANMFFAMTDTGILTALDANGNPQQIFDTDGDGVVDSTAILTGASRAVVANPQAGQAPILPVTGLAFSPFDFNLWHPTYRRQNDPGHAMGGATGLGTTNDFVINEFPASGRGQDAINASMYFGWEPWNGGFTGYTTNSYQEYIYGNGPALGSGDATQITNGGQYGVTRARRQQELSTNPRFNTASYNLPAGAYGSLMTDKFSLATMAATDKPTFYFDYFLGTEDANVAGQAGDGEMRDSARVYVGPFTRFDSTGGPYVSGNVLDLNATGTPTQFSGSSSSTTLSGEDGFYTGKALRFSSGALNGQTRIITGYIGATKTFQFSDGFTANGAPTAPASGDLFSIAYGYVTWDLLATNNSVLDSPGTTSYREGELGTFLSTSTSILPSNPRQQVQLMHDNTGEWRQARVDLSRYAGQTNLQLRFDFSTAGQMPDPRGRLSPWPQNFNGSTNARGIFPQAQIDVDPGQEYLFEDGFGRMLFIDDIQNNNHEGFYVDNIIIGPAERGEMVINAPSDTSFLNVTQNTLTQPRNYDPINPLPTQVLTGPYQLEIRRAAEYGLSANGPLGVPNYSHNEQTPILLLDTNDRLIPDQRLTTPIPVESFETQNFTGSGLKWGFNDDAPWTIANTASAGSFSAASGRITNGQSSGLSISLTTGGGNLTFSRSVDTEPANPATQKRGDVLRLFIDGRLATYTHENGVMFATPQVAEWSGNIGFETITVPVAAGFHNFRWTYDKDNSDPLNPTSQDKVFIDDIRFPTPQLGLGSIYEDGSLHQVTNPNAATPPISPTIAPPNSANQIHYIDTLFPGFTQGGDTNLDRQQGHVQIEMNQIFASSQVGILIDAAPRQAGTNNPYPGGVRNLPTLNTERLVPGVTVSNNIVSNSGLAGIQYSGDANTPINGLAVPTAAVPFGRIANNTVYGGFSPNGIGILVSDNAGPTLLNNIVANTATGISVDTTSTATTVLGANLYANNQQDVLPGGSTGSNPIVLPPNAPLFINAANRNFYPAKNSLAIDSALNSLADRPSIASVKSAIGIPQSPILVPDRDIYGQLRVDDPNQDPPPGFGQNVFKERGAVERADFTSPNVSIKEPVDNDENTPFRDRNRNPNDVAIRNENLTQFVIKLSDDGVGIDDFTVDPLKDGSQFVITQDGVVLNNQFAAAALGVSPDYQFVYNAALDEVIFAPSAGIWPLNHTYRITLNNNPLDATDSLGNPLAPGIFDLAGNPLAANRDTGEVTFSIFVGTLFDFGDAPDPYPTKFADSGAAHVVQDGYFLGSGISEESDAVQDAIATADSDNPPPASPNLFSDGILFASNPAPSRTVTIVNTVTITASIPTGMTGRIDAWFDLNRDQDWLDAGEKIELKRVLANGTPDPNGTNEVFDGTNTYTYTFGDASTTKGSTFARFRLSPAGLNSPNYVLVNGVVPDGEVEDKQILVSGGPFQNPKNNFPRNELDVNDDGFIAADDVLTIINYINAFGSVPLALGQPPIPNPALGPGKSLYVDTAPLGGDLNMSSADVIAVINYLNSIKIIGGEAGSANTGNFTGFEGEASSASAAPAMATASDELIIPPVLLASSSVLLEVRDQTPVAALAIEQILGESSAEDAALSALTASKSLEDSLCLTASKLAKSNGESSDEESWEDLLGSLAEDQHYTQ